MMPGMDGLEVCRAARQRGQGPYVYVILLTARGQKEDIVAGLEAGADDYVAKPFNPAELRSRLRVGERVTTLETTLAHKVRALEAALAHVKQLQGLLPICMHCQKIRDKGDTWHKLETYIEEHSDVMFSHALCDECLATYYPEEEDDKEQRP
jgi:response regulator RpfG family c-di-GMP phosphodiesterase